VKQLETCGSAEDRESQRDVLKEAARIGDSKAILEMDRRLDINVYKDLRPRGYSYEATAWFRLGTVNLSRWYRDSELRKSYVTFDADDGLGESYYYYQDGLPILAVRRRTTFATLRSDPSFDPGTARIEEQWWLFFQGRWIGDCQPDRRALRSSASLSVLEAARVYADALLYKYLP
jgi:hypothetical protein